MLHFPDWDTPFEIHCDASKQAVGAILNQHVEGEERVIMYASRTLNPSEKKYHTYEQECLALVWAVELFFDSTSEIGEQSSAQIAVHWSG